MSEGNSTERARMMAALGADVVLVPQCARSQPGHVTGEDLARVEARAQEPTRQKRAFSVDQFVRVHNKLAHEKSGTELWHQTNGQIDAFCDFVGTGGTFAGVTTVLKHHRPAVRCYIVEPEGAAVVSGQSLSNANHRIQGGGYGISKLSLLTSVPVDGYLQIKDNEAIDFARQLACQEGLFAGFSSGAVLAAAMRLLKGKHSGQTIAIMLADSGLKYLSTDLWT